MLLGVAAVSAELAVPAPPTRRINDYAGALTPADRDRLEQKLIERERGTSNQIVVAIFPSLRGESLEDYSVRLAQAWRVGQKGLDNGVVFLVFLEDRKMRLEVGYGLEGTLTDAIAASIIRDVVAPRFRQGRLADGIEAGLDAIAAAIAGTYARPTPAGESTLRRSGWSWDTQNSLIVIGVTVMVLAAASLLLIGIIQSRRSRRHGWTGGRRGWSGGGFGWPSGGGGGSGGGSGGGFSGGGGGFGGGGASGGW